MNLTLKNMNIKTFLVICLAMFCLLISACGIGKTDTATEKIADIAKPAESPARTNLGDAVQGYMGDDKSKKKNTQPIPMPTKTPKPDKVPCELRPGCGSDRTRIGPGVKYKGNV